MGRTPPPAGYRLLPVKCGKRDDLSSRPRAARNASSTNARTWPHEIVRDPIRTDELVVGTISDGPAETEVARKLARPTVDTVALHDEIETLRS